MESFRALPQLSSNRPALIFVHGSFHGGWCWAEHYLTFFAERGYPAYSVSLRGTSGSPTGAKSVAIGEHVGDLKAFIGLISEVHKGASKPVVIAHSFGGVALMKLLEAHADVVGGAAFLCSVPPSGNGPMTKRFLYSRPIASIKIVLGFVAKLACSRPRLARELFFGDTLDGDDAALGKYMAAFTRDSKVGLDLKALAGALPSLRTGPDGIATWWQQPDLATTPPVLVVGAALDFIVDEAGVAETARFLGGAPYAILPGTPHDVMLGKRWLLAASELEDWLGKLC
jgi:pimeloyl-ACP methyl ester carboxylesterase